MRKFVIAMLSISFSVLCFADKVSQSTINDDQWSATFETLLPLGEELRKQLNDPDDVLAVQELYRNMFLLVSQSYGGLVYQSADYPDFWPQFSTMYNYGILNVDDAYYTTPVDPNGVYKITGFRGSAHFVDFQVGNGHLFYKGLGEFGPALNNYDFDQEIRASKKDGAFEFILSAERPKDYQGDWLHLDPRAHYLFIRQVFYDWENEVTGRFTIERLDLPATKPRDSAEQIAANMKPVDEVVKNWVRLVSGITRELRDKGQINRMGVRDFSGDGGVNTQVYMDTLFEVADDEALIYEVEIPKNCFYWNLIIYDELWQVLDWMHRFSSINGHYAQQDRDGKYRIVISKQDPGVPNWLDTSGYQTGGLVGRFNRCKGEIDPQIKRVKMSELPQQLPKDTPQISAAQRDQALRDRRRAMQLRRRW